jgi:hypothetical protein|tara:strand:- start:141 stop:776 length:636 start_codon:yes stop_codon:yes gene_type:complete
MTTPVKHYLVTSGPIKKAILKKIHDYKEFVEAACNFRRQYGAEKACSTGIEHIGVVGALFTNGEAPEDWTKPRRAGCISRPKEGSKAHNVLLNLPKYQTNTYMLKELVGLPVAFKSKGVGESMLFNELNPVKLEGVPKYGQFLLTVPDVNKIADSLVNDGLMDPDNMENWQFDTPGVVEITLDDWKEITDVFKQHENAYNLPYMPVVKFEK